MKNISTTIRLLSTIFLWLVSILIIGNSLLLVSCSDDNNDPDDDKQQTVVIFMPWTGDAEGNHGLYNTFLKNLNSIEQAVIDNKGYDGRLLVFISTSARVSNLYEIVYENGTIHHSLIKTYNGNDYTTPSGFAKILNNVKSASPTIYYSMIIGGHGCGWTYASDWEQSANVPKLTQCLANSKDSVNAFPATRFFGSNSPNDYAIDVETLAEGISQVGLTLQYILFDNCYMANIETAYALRHVTRWLVASTSEIMTIGMPYASIWKELGSSSPSYQNIVNSFHSFYSTYSTPCGTLSAIDCQQTEAMASIMQRINRYHSLPDSVVDSIQVLDGYNPSIFYDFGDYVDHLCKEESFLQEFHTQLKRTVPYASTTSTIYSYLYARPTYISVKTFSGITISDPSQNLIAAKGIKKTAWWEATHKK